MFNGDVILVLSRLPFRLDCVEASAPLTGMGIEVSVGFGISSAIGEICGCAASTDVGCAAVGFALIAVEVGG